MTPESPAMKRSHITLRRHVGAVLFVGIFAIGIFVGRSNVGGALAGDSLDTSSTPTIIKNQNAVQKLSKDIDFRQFWDIWNRIQAKSVKRPIDEHKLFYGALQGMVASLGDPYSVYFTPEIATQFQEELQGSFSGIGAEVGSKDGHVIVVAPLADSPAERAGVEAGDVILKINQDSTTGLAVDEAVKRIRGPEGTSVSLTIEHVGAKDSITITIKREKIELKSVTSKIISDNIELITVTSFNEQTAPQFENAVTLAQKNKVTGIVLDLRNNPGGFFESAIDFASEWLDDGQIVVSQRGVDKTKREDFKSRGTHRLRGIPTAVLVNAGSASAAEIVSGALQDTAKAKIIGVKSFGKGSVQEYEELADGSAIKLTVALWYTPNDKSINELGITPDIIVDEKKDATKQTEDPFVGKKDISKDAVIQRALEYLRSGK